MMGLVASTGGPDALVKVLGALPADFPLPILLVQHITPSFLEGFVVLARRPMPALRSAWPRTARSPRRAGSTWRRPTATWSSSGGRLRLDARRAGLRPAAVRDASCSGRWRATRGRGPWACC